MGFQNKYFPKGEMDDIVGRGSLGIGKIICYFKAITGTQLTGNENKGYLDRGICYQQVVTSPQNMGARITIFAFKGMTAFSYTDFEFILLTHAL